MTDREKILKKMETDDWQRYKDTGMQRYRKKERQRQRDTETERLIFPTLL